MPKKKKLKLKIKFTKKQRVLVRTIGIPLLAGFVCLNIGIVGTRFFEARTQPRNLVWAADKTVVVPGDLRTFLNDQDNCQNYRGTGSPTGVGLWGVYQVSRGKFAKIAYGCSWSLSSYTMAVKDKGGWKLLTPTDYFAPFENNTVGAVPFCTFIDTYQIDSSIEPFCIDASGAARDNTIK